MNLWIKGIKLIASEISQPQIYLDAWMFDGEGGLPFLGVVLELVLLSQRSLSIVVQTILVVNKAVRRKFLRYD